MSSKTSKSQMIWSFCKKCNVYLHSRDKDIHSASCPIGDELGAHPYIKNNVLFSSVETKSKDVIEGLSTHDINDFVFLSQSSMQICDFKIGDMVVVSLLNYPPIVRTVWPSTEKSSTSVLMTELGITLAWGKIENTRVYVKKLPVIEQITPAVVLQIQNAPKNLEFTSEITKRIQRKYVDSIICVGNYLSLVYYGKILTFKVTDITYGTSTTGNLEDKFNEVNIGEVKESFYKVDKKTKFSIQSKNHELTKRVETNLSRLGGVNSVALKINHLIETYFNTKNKTCPTVIASVLLYGFSGTGKSSLVNSLALEAFNKYALKIKYISNSTIFSKYSGETEENLRLQFQEALDTAPTIIIFDDIDLFCPIKSAKVSEQQKRITATTIELFDQLHQNAYNKVFVLATSNNPDSIDQSLRRFGRLDMEIEMPIPDANCRKEIFSKLLQQIQNCTISLEEINKLSTLTPGYVGSDMMLVCATALANSTQQKSASVKFGDFLSALKIIKPSAMREAQIESPNVKWSDIGGQNDLKLKLKQALEWPLAHPESFTRMGLTPPRGVLMYGPPGCSKTMIAKALATETKFNFLSIKGPELFNKYVGESERAVRDVFKKARQASPSIVFFDEIDAIGGERSTSGSGSNVQERVLAQLLTELDGVTALGNVTVVAATNRPDRIDKALLRPGRLDRIVYVPLPNAATRREIINIRINQMPVVFLNKEEDINYLVQRTDGYSGAEVQAVCNEAAMKSLEENLEATEVRIGHFEQALNIVTPRTPQSLLNIYDEYTRT